MNIAVVCPYSLDRFGGVQAQTTGLVERLRGEGHAAWLVAPGRAGPERARLVGSTVTIPANRSTVPVALGPGVPGRVRRALAGADLVHVHEPLMPLVSWSALATRAPIVGTFHADPSDLIRRSYRVAGPVLGIRRRLAAVTAVSRVAAAAAEPLFEKVTVIPNAVEVSAVPDVEKVPTRVAFVGRDDPRKGLEVLLEAWPGVAGAVPGAELVVLGVERRDSSGVRFLGRVPDADKMAALAAAGVFCAPNIGGESFGITLVEAMSAGCRIVASDLPGFREVLGGLGDLVPPGDPEALAGALVSALAAPNNPKPWRERAAEFDWSVVVPRYIEVYRAALRGAGA
jgi:phosphatidylinositol alpha-mannosyltransferase